MAGEPSLIIFRFNELAEMLIKDQNIHEGIWGLFVKFGISAVNVTDASGETRPTAMIPILEIGLQKFDEASSLAVDAAVVNPAPKKVIAKTKKVIAKKTTT